MEQSFRFRDPFSEFEVEDEVAMDIDIQDQEVEITARRQAWLADWRNVMNKMHKLVESLKVKEDADAAKNAQQPSESAMPSLPNPKDTEGFLRQIDLTPVGPPGRRQGAANSNRKELGGDSVNSVNSFYNSGGSYGRRSSRTPKRSDVGEGGLKSKSQPQVKVTPKRSGNTGTEPQIPLSVGLVNAKENVYSIEKIVDARLESTEDSQRFMYKVRWTGWPAKYDSWIQEEDLGNPISINNFWREKMSRSNNKKISTIRQGSSSSPSETHTQLTQSPYAISDEIILECFM